MGRMGYYVCNAALGGGAGLAQFLHVTALRITYRSMQARPAHLTYCPETPNGKRRPYG